jgi:hypothetical protein
MVSSEGLKKALAELGIVVLGVMIALAADSWREDLLEARIEARYLARLSDDVSSGLAVLRIERETYRSVIEAARTLTDEIEKNPLSVEDDFLVDNLIIATQMGFDRNEMASDVAYREMVESGQLNLIRNDEIREGVVTYYWNTDRLIQSLEVLPDVNNTFASLTGYYPLEITVFDEELNASGKLRLAAAAREDPELTKQLRLLHAEAHFNDRLFEQLISQAQELLSLLE